MFVIMAIKISAEIDSRFGDNSNDRLNFYNNKIIIYMKVINAKLTKQERITNMNFLIYIRYLLIGVRFFADVKLQDYDIISLICSLIRKITNKNLPLIILHVLDKI